MAMSDTTSQKSTHEVLRHRCAVFEFRCAERLPDILPKYLDKIFFVLCLIASFSLFHAHNVRTSLMRPVLFCRRHRLIALRASASAENVFRASSLASEYPSNDSR